MITSKMKTLQLILILSDLSNGAIMYQPLSKNDRKCVGSLGLYKDSQLVGTYSSSEEAVWEQPNRAVLHGCGCFVLYHKKKGEGDHYYVDRVGEHNIPLVRVRSMYRVQCSETNFPWPVFISCCLILSLIFLMMFLSLLLSRRLSFVQ